MAFASKPKRLDPEDSELLKIIRGVELAEKPRDGIVAVIPYNIRKKVVRDGEQHWAGGTADYNPPAIRYEDAYSSLESAQKPRRF